MSLSSVEQSILGKTYVVAGRMIFDAWKNNQLTLSEYQQMCNYYEVWSGGSQIVTGSHFSGTTEQRAIAFEATPSYIEQKAAIETQNLVPTSEVRPLISSGVAEKLKEAGFGSDVVDPLTKTGWSQNNVDNLMEVSRDIGIIPPRDIQAQTLIVTPVEEIQTAAISPKFNPLILLGLGLGVLFLSRKV
jgi:hypothetical protein